MYEGDGEEATKVEGGPSASRPARCDWPLLGNPLAGALTPCQAHHPPTHPGLGRPARVFLHVDCGPRSKAEAAAHAQVDFKVSSRSRLPAQ